MECSIHGLRRELEKNLRSLIETAASLYKVNDSALCLDAIEVLVGFGFPIGRDVLEVC
jgi:hypothetical protein